jgi:hypothetical protein
MKVSIRRLPGLKSTARTVAATALRFLKFKSTPLVLLLIAFAAPVRPADQTLTFKVPPVKIPLNLKDQRVTIVAWALITVTRKNHGSNVVDLTLSADLSGLQQNLTAVLSSELDKDDRCGDRIAVQHASLVPQEPASATLVELHYERWGCVKVFGKQKAKRLAGGNLAIPMKLTPAVEENNTQLRLVPEVGPIQADGSLGELLRAGSLGHMLQDKIRGAILAALQRGTNLSATLPGAVQGYATIQSARFVDAGAGRLAVVLAGEFHITDQQIELLSKQVKELAASR